MSGLGFVSLIVRCAQSNNNHSNHCARGNSNNNGKREKSASDCARVFPFAASKSALISILILCLLSLVRGGEGQYVIGSFRHLAHGLQSGPMTILNDKQILIPNLKYDGKGPAAWFAVGSKGRDFIKERVDLQNITLIPDEYGSCDVLKPYDGSKSIILTLPGKLTMHDITYMVVYCIEYNHNFGYVEIPQGLPLTPVDTGYVPACPRKYYGKGVKGLTADESESAGVAIGQYPEHYYYYYLPVVSYLFNSFGYYTGAY